MLDHAEILNIGLPLHAHGINSWALSVEQVLRLLPDLERRQVAILGGDVCEMIEQKPALNNDNWYCDRGMSETQEAYVKRSLDKTREYVQTYVSPRGGSALFILVLASQP